MPDSSGPQAEPPGVPSALPPPHLTTLANGLRVVSLNRPGAPEAVALWVDAGSADELAHEHGAAHLLEHMLFKGTARRAVGEAAAALEALGGDLNAWTSYDQTVLHAVVGPGHWHTALDVLSDMALHSRIDPDELTREQPVVLEELHSADDDPDSLLADAVQEALWGAHPYARRILGTDASVRAQTSASLRAFHSRTWCANRAVLTVVGGVDHSDVVDAAKRSLGHWAAAADPRPSPTPAPMQGPRLLHINRDFDSLGAVVAVPCPPIGHPDLPALAVLAAVLGQGGGALLHSALHLDAEVAYSTHAALMPGRLGSSFELAFVPYPGQTRRALDLLFAVLDRVLLAPDGAEVVRARDGLLSDMLFGDETSEGAAQELAWYTACFGDPTAKRTQRDALAAVTPADVARVARTWIRREATVLGVLDPHVSAPMLQPVLRGRAPLHRADQPLTHRTEAGVRVLVQPSPGPVAAVHLSMLGGDLRLADFPAGVGEAWAQLLPAGAAGRDATALGEQLDALGASVHSTSGRHGIGLGASFPSANLRSVLKILGEVLTQPRLDGPSWNRVRSQLRDDLRTRLDRPWDVARDAARAWVWQDHPWSKPEGGTRASLSELGPRKLQRWHQAHLTSDNLVVAVAGGIHPDVVLDALPWLSKIPKGEAALPPRPALGPLSSITQELRAGSQQAHVALHLRGLALNHPLRRALDLASHLLGSQSGRLFLDLRETRSLAYDVWARSWSGLDGGSFAMGLSTPPERAEEATAALTEHLLALAEQRPTREEVERTRSMILGRIALERERASQRAALLAAGATLGVPTDVPTLTDAWRAITAAQVQEAVALVASGGVLTQRVLPRTA